MLQVLSRVRRITYRRASLRELEGSRLLPGNLPRLPFICNSGTGEPRGREERFSKARGRKIQALRKENPSPGGRKIKAGGRKIQIISFHESSLFKGLRRLRAKIIFSS